MWEELNTSQASMLKRKRLLLNFARDPLEVPAKNKVEKHRVGQVQAILIASGP